MSTVRVTCGHIELGKKVVCEGCYKEEQARGRRLREAIEKHLSLCPLCDTNQTGQDCDCRKKINGDYLKAALQSEDAGGGEVKS